MTARLARLMPVRLIGALLLPLALASCVLAPGKFVSTLTIDADRSFAFTYVGEVYAVDMPNDLKDLKDDDSDDDAQSPSDADDDDDPVMLPIAKQAAPQAKPDDSAKDTADAERKNQAIAAALSKEAGYRKVAYLGGSKFMVDYAIKGVLTYNFVYPFNVDAEAVIPFLAAELRGAGTVRVKAPGFAGESNDQSAALGGDQAASKLDGIFTLDTDAEIVSQNSEDGVKTAGGRKTISWKATPLTKIAPMAVLKFADAAAPPAKP